MEERLPFLIIFISLLLMRVHAFEALAPIEVVADKDLKDFTLSSSQTITEAELQDGEDSLLSSKLHKVSGLIISQNGGPGGRTSYFLRGTESRHLAFTLDGLKLNDPSNTDRQYDAAFFSIPIVKEINIYKGPQAVLFGSDSMGGLIDMVTRKGENHPETRLSLKGGSFGTFETALSSDWHSAESGGTLTFSSFHTDGISRLNEKRFKATERDGADITNIISSSSHRWARPVSTDFLVGFIRGENELDGTTSDNSFDESKNDQYLFQQKTHLTLKKSNALSLRNGLNRHQRSIQSLAQGEQTFAGNIYQNEILFRSDYQKLNLATGVSSEHEDFSEVMKSFDTHAVFVQTSFKLNHFKFQAGGRGEKHTRYGSYQTGSLGGEFLFGDQSVSLQYSRGYKAPSLYQLYGPASIFGPVGNDNLVPESNHAWEGAWRLKSEIWVAEVSLFQNRLSNLISYGNSGYENQGRFITEGVDLTLTHRHKWYELVSGYTHQRFRENKVRVLRRPPNALKLNLAVFLDDRSEVALNSRWFSSRWDTDENFSSVKLNPYEVFDLGYRISFERIDYGLQLKNLLNREYEDLYGYGILPRSLFAHVGVSF